MMKLALWKRPSAAEKALRLVEKREARMAAAAMKARPAAWKTALEKKIPPKVYDGLQSAFGKAFALVFHQGRGLLEKSYSKEELLALHAVRDADARSGGAAGIKRMESGAKQSELFHTAVTAVEGVALGTLGIGMPDIVIFISTLLRGVYETALHYGYDYAEPREQLVILKLLEASLRTGDEWAAANAQADVMMTSDIPVSENTFRAQFQRTASVFAMDMLLLKFIQGIPLVGVIGGAANPGYYRKIMRYVRMKYRKRYLTDLISGKH